MINLKLTKMKNHLKNRIIMLNPHHLPAVVVEAAVEVIQAQKRKRKMKTR